MSIVGRAGATPGAESTPAAEVAQGAAEQTHDETYYRKTMGKLLARLHVHERELAVLQQKLDLAGPQYYANPNQALLQQYSRLEINRLTEDIETKKQQIAQDQQAIEDLRTQLRREGGEPGWLREPVLPSGQGEAESATALGANVEAGAVKPELTQGGVQKTSREYWLAKLKSARERLRNAQEEQQLAEDELSLLQTRRARELAPATQSALNQQIAIKQAEVEDKREAAAKAAKVLEEIEKEFRESGTEKQ